MRWQNPPGGISVHEITIALRWRVTVVLCTMVDRWGTSRLSIEEFFLACPFFLPTEQLRGGAWIHPTRLPLAAGWEGTCTAPGHEGATPESFEPCNLGYASTCPRLPQERRWDAVRFAVLQESSERSLLVYVCEKDHLPADHGNLEFCVRDGACAKPHPDPRIQKMAECFLASRRANSAGPPEKHESEPA